jgi:hypothetical protein
MNKFECVCIEEIDCIENYKKEHNKLEEMIIEKFRNKKQKHQKSQNNFLHNLEDDILCVVEPIVSTQQYQSDFINKLFLILSVCLITIVFFIYSNKTTK